MILRGCVSVYHIWADLQRELADLMMLQVVLHANQPNVTEGETTRARSDPSARICGS